MSVGYLVAGIGDLLQAFSDQGVVLAGGKIATYVGGTVNTPVVTYQDSTLGAQNTNPIVLTSAGRLPAACWVPAGTVVKMVLMDSVNNVLRTIDNLPAINDTAALQSYGFLTYGGTTTNAGNNYALTSPFPYSSYFDGMELQFFPNASNTAGGTTLNVNTLGVVTVVNWDGSALTANQFAIGVPTGVIYKGGQFILSTSGSFAYTSGSFTPTWTGFSAAPSGTVFWSKTGTIATMTFSVNGTGTSNSTAMTFTNLPGALQPSTGGGARIPIIVTDAGVSAMGAIGFTLGTTMTFYIGTAPPSATGFTASGVKGMSFGATITYPVV